MGPSCEAAGWCSQTFFAVFVKALEPLAKKAHLNIESLYRMLSKKWNPEIKSIFTVLHAVGLRLTIQPEAAMKAA